MEGQWIGAPKDRPDATVLVDLEKRGDRYEGTAFLFEGPDLPATCVAIATPDRNPSQRLKDVPTFPVLPGYGPIERSRLAEVYPDVQVPETADIDIDLSARLLKVSWATPIGTSGTATLPRSRAARRSDYRCERSARTWPKFKQFALGLPPRRYIFRGQSSQHRLRTSFHRSWRKDLVRYINKDIPALHQVLSARTRHVFNLANPMENGAFYNLLQHHGYPTPLLDWTYSPFVAAYFALSSAVEETGKARIFVFDKEAWCRDWKQLQILTWSLPHFSILEALAIENDRAIPQQALSSVTNVDDVESYIRWMEQRAGKQYLRAIDLPLANREDILVELGLMGITAGSLFPGLDGACKEQRARFFGH